MDWREAELRSHLMKSATGRKLSRIGGRQICPLPLQKLTPLQGVSKPGALVLVDALETWWGVGLRQGPAARRKPKGVVSWQPCTSTVSEPYNYEKTIRRTYRCDERDV